MDTPQSIEMTKAASVGTDPLRAPLLDSRERWRGFALIAADMMFETDLAGRLTFLAPEQVLGWPAAALVGHAAEMLLARTATSDRPEAEPAPEPPADPFSFAVAVQDRCVWLRDAEGRPACMAISSAPLLDQDGRRVGTRGVGLDVTEREGRDAASAATLRRGDVLDHILGHMRQEVAAPRMMQAVLEAVMRAMGGHGAAVLDLTPAPDDEAPGPPWPVLHRAGADPAPILPAALALLQGQDDADAPDGVAVSMPTVAGMADGLTILGCPASTRFGERAGLVIWRAAGHRTWDADDHTLAASVTGVIRIVLEHEGIQRELARQARTDPLTGLMNRRAFLDEAARRIDRLDREGLPGTLLFVDLDRLKPLNDRLGHDAGDEALVLTAELLRRTVRPTDLVARLGGDEFALWLDGSDELTAAERAEGLRTGCLQTMAHLTGLDPEDRGVGDPALGGMTMSIGIACRQAGGGEELESLLHRADQAMYEVKRAGRGHWRVSHSAPTI